MAISLPRLGKSKPNPNAEQNQQRQARPEQRVARPTGTAAPQAQRPQQTQRPQAAAPTSAPPQAVSSQSSGNPQQEVSKSPQGFGTSQEEMFKCLARSKDRGSSDIIFSVGLPPMFRVNGKIERDKFPILNSDMVKKMVYSILRQDQIAEYEATHELDLSLSVPGIARYRVNVYRQKRCVSAAFRAITESIPTFKELGLSKPIESLALLPRGLVLVTGPTGSGKSSTLAAMVDLINEKKHGHIITVEDPIEYVHKHKNCIVDQRELKTDTESFTVALRYVLRQDPDTILVGEMRDLETISAAISAAETGHMVLSTLHTQDAAQTVDRIVDVFPSFQQDQIRAQLSTTLRGIISQQLIPKIGGGRVAAREILLVTSAIANLIREGKTYQINSAIQTGTKLGMISMDACLNSLYHQNIITYEDAIAKAIYRENIKPNI